MIMFFMFHFVEGLICKQIACFLKYNINYIYISKGGLFCSDLWLTFTGDTGLRIFC
jgi:hypothetical protein